MSSIWDNTYTLGNSSATVISAGPGIKIDDQSTPGVIKVSNDETVLWSGTNGATACTLSEPISAFDRLRIYCNKYDTNFICDGVINSNTSFSFAGQNFSDRDNESQRFWLCGGSYTGSNLNFASHYGQLIYFKYGAAQFTYENMNVPITKIIGINRKQNT